MANLHGLSDAIFEIKDKLTDGEFKKLMELCKTEFDDKKDGFYEINILTIQLCDEDDGDEDEDDDDDMLDVKLRFSPLKFILQLTDDEFKSISEREYIDTRLVERAVDLYAFKCRDIAITIAELPLVSIKRVR